jgi:hypothetical protein
LGSGQEKRKHKSELIEGLRKWKAVDCKRKTEKVKKRKTINVKLLIVLTNSWVGSNIKRLQKRKYMAFTRDETEQRRQTESISLQKIEFTKVQIP